MGGTRVRDPMEARVAAALTEAGVEYVTEEDPRAKGLDFYLPTRDLHIEVKRFHSARVAEQVARATNVIVLQGLAAVDLFCYMVRASARAKRLDDYNPAFLNRGPGS